MNLLFASIEKKARIVLFAMLLLLPAGLMAQGEAYTINHGPYLQGLTYDGVIVCFTTSHREFSGVEIRRRGSDEVRLCRTSKDGLFEADNTRTDLLRQLPAH